MCRLCISSMSSVSGGGAVATNIGSSTGLAKGICAALKKKKILNY